jgi:hypothetical protein
VSFYQFLQNNSGGRNVKDMPKLLFVEASSAEEANERAESIGVYFNGCEDGTDCSCCGDRWYPASEYDKSEEPTTEGYDWATPWGVLRAGASKWEQIRGDS